MKGMSRRYKKEYLWEFMWRDRFSMNSYYNICSHIRQYYTPLDINTSNNSINDHDNNSDFDSISFNISDSDSFANMFHDNFNL
jgi:hypothetical protein